MSLESQSSSEETTGWVRWFCKMQEHQFLCQVDEEFIRDAFNLYGIKQKFNHYNHLNDFKNIGTQLVIKIGPKIYQQATCIYGLIHARWILTPKGLSQMKEKYILGKFGICPRVLCERQHVLPVGMSQEIKTSRVKIYCPKCQDIFLPKRKYPDIDGAFFGCSFPNILLLAYQDIRVRVNDSNYIPKIYGFKIFQQKGSKYEVKKDKEEISYYSQEYLKNIKGVREKGNGNNKHLN